MQGQSSPIADTNYTAFCNSFRINTVVWGRLRLSADGINAQWTIFGVFLDGGCPPLAAAYAAASAICPLARLLRMTLVPDP